MDGYRPFEGTAVPVGVGGVRKGRERGGNVRMHGSVTFMVNTRTHAHMHTCMHAHAHTHTQTLSLSPSLHNNTNQNRISHTTIYVNDNY